jgi:predicted O-methyltransferase YrrM
MFCSCLMAKDLSRLPDPYNQAKLMPYKLDGWYSLANRKAIKRLISAYKVNTIVEVGSWIGLSTVDMAKKIPEHGKVYAVDTWEGSEEHKNNPELLKTLYDQFLSNVIHEQLTHKIIPIRMDSVKAAQKLQVVADLIYIDADHSYEGCYADLKAWFPHVKEGGILCGDDWPWEGVSKAVEQFAHEHNLKININNPFWWIIK